MNKLAVSETFYSIQGEGQTQGIPAVFIRLAGCNLLCQGKWECDTIKVWRKGKKKEFKDVLSERYISHLKEGAHLVITGGEPLLQQRSIRNYLAWVVREYDFIPIVEIETNGTILPLNSLSGHIDYWNVSPKLKNSGLLYEERINEVALLRLSGYNTIFKFVISEESDWIEIMQDFDMIDFTKIWLMPAAETREDLIKNSPAVVKLAIENRVKFSNRLQLQIWNKTTGV